MHLHTQYDNRWRHSQENAGSQIFFISIKYCDQCHHNKDKEIQISTSNDLFISAYDHELWFKSTSIHSCDLGNEPSFRNCHGNWKYYMKRLFVRIFLLLRHLRKRFIWQFMRQFHAEGLTQSNCLIVSDRLWHFWNWSNIATSPKLIRIPTEIKKLTLVNVRKLLTFRPPPSNTVNVRCRFCRRTVRS